MAMTKIPTLVGHRGWPARYPENTLEGFAAAADAGARWLECDVQLSADKVPFVSHDVSLQRTAALDRNITDMAASELLNVGVGEAARFGQRYAQVKLPTLASLIAWLQTRPQLTLFVEIKRQSLRHHGTQTVVVEIMRNIQPALAQCIVISFDHACLALARQQGARAIGWAVEQATAEAAATAHDLGPDYLFTDVGLFARMHTALAGPWQWIAYHTEDAQRALELAHQGAACVETNDVGTLLDDPRLKPHA